MSQDVFGWNENLGSEVRFLLQRKGFQKHRQALGSGTNSHENQ